MVLDDDGEEELGRRLGLSGRHLRRLFQEHLGLTPDQLARSRRAHFARRMLDDTDLNIADVAFASGFGSLRQFNRTMRDIFRANPQQLRLRRRRADRLATDGGVTLRLPLTEPYDWDATLKFLAAHAVSGVESVNGGAYRRTIMLDDDPGMLEVHPGGPDHLLLRAHLPHWEGLIHVVERARRMLALDSDPAAPRIPGVWGPFEAGVAAISAPADLGRLVQLHGQRIPGLPHGLTHAFPAPETLLHSGGTVQAFAEAVVSGQVRLDGSATLDRLLASLVAVPGFSREAARLFASRLGESPAGGWKN